MAPQAQNLLQGDWICFTGYHRDCGKAEGQMVLFGVLQVL